MKKKVIRFFALLVFVVVGLAVLHFLQFGSFTGFAIFSDSSGGDFDNGIYMNTTYNGSSVVLVGENLSGSFTSQIFDAGADANWNNLSFVGGNENVEFLFAVDGSGAVFASVDEGVNWTEQNDDYGGGAATSDMFSDSNYLYILFGNSGGEVYRSSDLGVSWTKVADDVASNIQIGDSNSSDVSFVFLGNGAVLMSNNSGVNWSSVGDFNGGSSSNPKGIAINSNDEIFAVDGSGSVFVSTNGGADWTEQTSGYGGGSGTDDLDVDGSGNLYILLNRDIYKSIDKGVNWIVINDSFSDNQDGLTMVIDSSDNFYIVDPSGDVFESTNFGISWDLVGDFNGGASNNIAGLTSFSRQTNLTFQVRNCSLSNCGDGFFVGPDGTGESYYSSNVDLDAVGQYFQYRFFFESPDGSFSPSLESVVIDYELVNREPVVNIFTPADDDSYGTNESLALNFSVSDVDGNLDSCWYNLNGGGNVTILSCANTTFDVSGSGSFTLNVFANDTFGLENADSVNFSVALGAPSIGLSFPIDVYLDSGDGVVFNYTPSDIDLATCSLLGDFSGNFEINQTDFSPISGNTNSFNLNLSDGAYLWNVACNDTLGNRAVNGNKTFWVDTTNPGVVLSEPLGTKTSRSDIELEFSVDESNKDSCWYNVFRGVNEEIGNRSVNCSLGSDSFNVTVDADFVLNFFANDSAGNSNFKSSSFSVDTSVSSPPSSGGSGGGGGGGGGGGSVVSVEGNKLSIEFSGLEDLILKRGTGQEISLRVLNKDVRFINNCNLSFGGDAGGWLSSGQSKGLSRGERYTYNVNLFVSEDTEPGEYAAEIKMECDEGSASTNFGIGVYRNAYEAEFLDYEREGNELVVRYSLEEFSGEDHSILIDYEFLDFDGIARYKGKEEIVLGRRDYAENVIRFELPKDSFGEFEFKMNFSDGATEIEVIGDVFLPSEKSILGGLAISDSARQKLSTVGFVFLVILILFVVWWVHGRFKKKTKAINGVKKGKKFIALDLEF